MAHVYRLMGAAVKGAAMTPLPQALMRSTGLAGSHDFALLSVSGVDGLDLLTQRQCPQLVLLHAWVDTTTGAPLLHINFAGQGRFSVALRRSQLAERVGRFNGDLCPGFDLGDDVAACLSMAVGRPCRLLWRNYAYPRHTEHGDEDVKAAIGYQDGWPFTAVSTASLRAVAAFDKKKADLDEMILRLRPTWVVDGIDAFEEDTWKVVRVQTQDGGWIYFVMVKRRMRGQVPDVNPRMGVADWKGEGRLVSVLIRMGRGALPEFPDQSGSVVGPSLAVALRLQDPRAEAVVQQGAVVEVLERW